MTNEQTVAEAKRVLRLSMLDHLSAITPSQRRAASREACARLIELDEVRDAGLVLVYMALPTELDPASAAHVCLREGIRVAVPMIDDASGELEAVEIESLDERFFSRGPLGVRVPREGRRVRATELEAAVVPGVAFDRVGGRVGRGKGYYDRLLVRLPERCCTVGFAFESQLVERVPAEPHDRRVSMMVTESSVIECGASS